MEEAVELKKLEMREQKMESRQQFQQRTEMIQAMSINQEKRADETKQDLGLVIQKQETMEKRLDKLKNGGAAKGGYSFIEQHKILID